MTVGPDGRLADPVALGTGAITSGLPQDACHSAMAPGGSRPLPQETPGTYYWQVWRLCIACPASYEVGPILHFVIKSPAQMAVRSPAPARAFVGYPIAFGLTLTGVPDGTKVRLERRAGAVWRTVGTAHGARRAGRGDRRPAEGHAAPAADGRDRRRDGQLLRAPGARARREGVVDGRGRRRRVPGQGRAAAP